jgi:hypothetical protein
MSPGARRFLVVLLSLFLVGGCRQPDGPVPVPNEDELDEVSDISRDLQYIASGHDPQAPGDLADDLRKFVEEAGAESVADELSRLTADALRGSSLTEQAAQRLAHSLWMTVAARQMSERQIEALQNDIQFLLMSIGVADEQAEQVAAQVGAVQRAVTDRPRRWYERF